MNVVAVLLGGGQHVKRSTVAVDYWCAGNADLRVDRRVQSGGWNRRHALGRVEETDGPQSRTGLIIGVEGVDGVVLRRDVDHIVVLPCARIVIVISQNSSEGTTAGNFRDGDIGAVTFRGVSHASSVDGHLCGTRDLGRRRVQT